MRYNITVHVPQTMNVSYTLYANGFKIETPRLSEDESEYVFRFLGGTVTVLFYNFGKFKKAYVVTGWQDDRDGTPVILPGVDEKLCLIFSVRGKRFHILDKIIKYLTKDDEYGVYKLPLHFWYKIGSLIENHKFRNSYINNVLLLYNNESKNFFCNQKDIKLDNLEQRILDFCTIPKTMKEIADYCSYKNQSVFSAKYLNILVKTDLLNLKDGLYTKRGEL